MKAVTRSTGVVPYILKADQHRKPEEQSTFYIRPLTQGERMEANDRINITTVGPTGVVEQEGRGWRQALELCVTRIERIENFPDGAPKPWPVSEKERREYMEQFEDRDVSEIGTAIREASTMSTAAGN